MTQDQRWQIRVDEVINFMEKEHKSLLSTILREVDVSLHPS